MGHKTHRHWIRPSLITYQVAGYVKFTLDFCRLNAIQVVNRPKPRPSERPFKSWANFESYQKFPCKLFWFALADIGGVGCPFQKTKHWRSSSVSCKKFISIVNKLSFSKNFPNFQWNGGNPSSGKVFKMLSIDVAQKLPEQGNNKRAVPEP